MAQEVEISLRLQNAKALDDFKTQIKAIDLGFKSGTLSAEAARKEYQRLSTEIQKLNLTQKESVTIATQLWHANNRATVGFKSMATQLREMYREQMLGNRILGETRQAVMGLSGALGSTGLGRSVGSAIGNFDALESSLKAAGIAAGNAGGKLAGLSSTLVAFAGPAAAAAAVGLEFATQWAAAGRAMDAAREAYSKAMGMMGGGKPRTPGFALPIIGERTELTGSLMQMFPWLGAFGMRGAAAEATQDAAERMRRSEEMYGVTVTGQRGGTPATEAAATDTVRQTTGLRSGSPTSMSGAGFGRTGATGLWGRENAAFTRAYGGRAVGVQGPETTGVTDQMTQMGAMTQNLIQSLNVGVMSVANTVRTAVGGAFERVFGEANSLLEIFAQNMLSTFAGNLTQSLLSGLLSFIPGIGPALGGMLNKQSFTGGGYAVVENVGRNTTAAYKRGFYGY